MGALTRTRPVLFVLALLALLGVAGVTVVGLAGGAADRARLQEVLARHEAEGLGASFGDLVRSAPRVDRDRQDRAWAWMVRAGPETRAMQGLPAGRAWAFADPPQLPPTLRAAHEGFRTEAEALVRLLEEGDLYLSSLGWLDVTPEAADRLPLSKRAAVHLPNLLRLRAAATWFFTEACLADDPTPVLDHLDRLHRAVSRPGVLIDAMITVALDAQRDETYLALALRDRLDPVRLRTWLDEPARAREVTADGWRGERLLFAAPLAQDLVRGVSLAEHLEGQVEIDGPGDLWNWRVRPAFTATAECAVFLDGMAALERHLRGALGAIETRQALDALGGLGAPFGTMLPNGEAALTTAVGGETRARAVRAAAALAVQCRERGALPVDGADARLWLGARAHLLAPAPFALGLQVERPAADRFRVTVDPASPVPDLADPATSNWWTSVPPASWPDGEVYRCQGGVEVRLP